MATLKDAIFGLAVGDALGVPVEFENRDCFTVTDMQGFGSHNQPKGTWSDDTSMTLATCNSIKNQGGIVKIDIFTEFVNWLIDNQYNANGYVFDVGNTTRRAINSGQGEDGVYSNGNGSLMRIIPLAFVQDVSIQQIIDISSITHRHQVSCEICVYYVNIAKKLIEGKTS